MGIKKLTKAKETVVREYEGVSFTIGRIGTDAWHKAIRANTKEFGYKAEFSALTPQQQRHVMAKSAFGVALHGWDGVVDEETGAAVPFNQETCEELLILDRDCSDFIFGIASELQEFRLEADADTVKKSVTSITGS